MVDCAKSEMMFAAAHLCLMFSAYGGSPCKKQAAVKSIQVIAIMFQLLFLVLVV